jgi:hypothetical protein
MTYRLNVCNLSGTFEKRFGLPHFARDYTELLGELNAALEGVQNFKTTEQEIADWRHDYRVFCKLCHFFDDFNFFINTALSPKTTQDRYSKFGCPTNELKAFILRIKGMKIPQNLSDNIELFLTTELNNFLYRDVHKEENKPKLYIPDDYLEKLGAALNKEAEIGENGLNQFDRTRAKLLQQLASTLQKLPYMRLGQLISNSLPEDTDIFYVTDAKLIQLLKDFEAQHGLP